MHLTLCSMDTGERRGSAVECLTREEGPRVRASTASLPKNESNLLRQTVETQMKCNILWHFIRVCTIY